MRPKSFLLIISIILITTVLQAQKKRKINEELLDNFSRTISSQPDSAFYFINKAIVESSKDKDTFSLSRCYYNLGYYYYIKKEFEKSEKYIITAYPYAKSADNYSILSLIYNQLGLIYRDMAKYDKSLKYFQKSLDIAESRKLPKNQSIVFNNLGYLFELQNDTVKALEYYMMNQKNAIQNNLKFELLASYNNIGILKKRSDKQQSIENLNQAYDIAVELNDKYEQFNVLINLSDVYLSYNEPSKSKIGYQYLLKARDITELLADDNLMFYVYYNLGGYNLKTGKNKIAIIFYKTAMKYFKAGISEDQKLSLLKDMELAYKKSNNYEEAYFFKEKYTNLKDSIFNIQKNKVFKEIQTKYEVEKKNLKIDLLTKEKQIEKEKKKMILVVGIILLFILGAILLFYIYRIRTQRIISDKESEIHKQEIVRLEQEKELKKTLGIIEGQDKERNRLAKEIHDGIAGDLAGIKLHLSQANLILRDDTIEKVISQVSKTFTELRNISHDLSLNYIKDRSLEFLLKELKTDYERRMEFDVEVNIFPQNKIMLISKNIKHHLYRIIQELFNNVSKHANAENVFINITLYDDCLNLIFEDDGKGFYTIKRKGIGLKNIEERVTSINGEIILENKQKGSIIIINIPNYNEE